MTDAFIIETSTITAGIVAAYGQGFRFYASHPSMFSLDGQFFGTPKAAQRAAEILAGGPSPKAAPRSKWVSRWGYPVNGTSES
jgi:hypothetical protein